MGNHIHIFNTQAEYEANKQNITPPFIAHVKENNKMGMHADKTIGSLFNFQRKNVNITENGSFTIEPDSSYGALSSVNVKVNIGGASTNSKWTGHADAEGLRAIGWTDEDIAYYQENGVNWNEEDDEYHKVSDDNKALYGVLTANNISTYNDRIVYLPKIDTSGIANMDRMFQNCDALISIPMLDTSKVTNMSSMFKKCGSLSHANLKNVKLAYDLSSAQLQTKDSLLYIINNEAATSAITIKLSSFAYYRLANDPDVVAALANHPNISIAK